MITIKEEAAAYIAGKGGAAYLHDYNPTSMCCGRIQFSPSIQLGAPQEVESYDCLETQGINFYVPKSFDYPNPLVVELRSLLGLKSLQLEGWKLV